MIQNNEKIQEVAKQYLEVSTHFEKGAYDNVESIVINKLGSEELLDLYNTIGSEAVTKLLAKYGGNIQIKIPDRHEFYRLISASLGYYLKYITRLPNKDIKKILGVDDLKEILSLAKKVDNILIKEIENISEEMYECKPGTTG